MSWLSIQRCLNQLLTVLQGSREEDCKSRPLPAFSIAPNTCCCPIKGKLLATVQTEPCHPWRTPQWWHKWNSISSSSTSCTTIFVSHMPPTMHLPWQSIQFCTGFNLRIVIYYTCIYTPPYSLQSQLFVHTSFLPLLLWTFSWRS